MKYEKRVVRKIKKFCEEKNITIKELSRMTTLPVSELEDIFNGKNNNMGILAFMKICSGLDLSPDNLLSSTDENDKV